MKRIFDIIQRGAFVALWVILAVGFSSGQTYNNRYIFGDTEAVVFNSIIKSQDTLFIIGKAAVSFSPFPSKLMLTKMDFTGEHFFHQQEIGDSSLYYAPFTGSGLFPKGNKLLLTGSSGNYFVNTYGMAAVVEDGQNFKWLKIFESNGESSVFTLPGGVIKKDGSLLLAGTKKVGSYYSGILIHADSLGNEIWRREYKEPNHDYRLRSCMLESDTTLVLGFRFWESGEEFVNTMLMRIDTAGNELDRWMNDTEGTYEPKRILRTEDGGYLYIGKAFKEYGSTTGLPLTQGYICKLDSEWNKEWERKLGFRGKTTFHNVIELEDGDFVAVGNVLDTFQTADRYYRKGWMVKFDIDGNILWEQNPYRPETVESYLFDVVELPDGSLVACGVATNIQADSFPQRGWLVRVNANGCMDWGCFTGLNDYVPPDVSPYQVAPNPASDYFRVSVPEDAESLGLSSGIESIRVYDISGRGVFREEYPKGMTSIEMDASEWMSGVYFVVVNERWVEKIIKN